MAATLSRATGEAIRDAVLAVPGVAGLSAGRFGEVALLLPGTRIYGLRSVYRDQLAGVEVHFIFDVSSQLNIDNIAQQIRSAVAPVSNLDFVDVIAAEAQ